MRLDFVDGSKVVEEKSSDTFFIGFNTYLFLRESCYSCKYVGTKRIADITLADYWGVDLSLISEQQRRDGVSLIITNTEKGKNLIHNITNEMFIYPADSERAIHANQALEKPSTKNINRNKFFTELSCADFDVLVHRYNKSIFFKLRARKLLGDSLYDCLKKIIGRV